MNHWCGRWYYYYFENGGYCLWNLRMYMLYFFEIMCKNRDLIPRSHAIGSFSSLPCAYRCHMMTPCYHSTFTPHNPPGASFEGAGGAVPQRKRKKKKERKKEKREKEKKIRKREKRKKGTMNNVKLLHFKWCFPNFSIVRWHWKIQKFFGPKKSWNDAPAPPPPSETPSPQLASFQRSPYSQPVCDIGWNRLGDPAKGAQPWTCLHGRHQLVIIHRPKSQ